MFSSAISRSCARWPSRQRGVQLAGLGVDEVGRERARVAAEQRVRERAVAPEEAGEVEPDEQLGERVEQPVAQVGEPPRLREERAVRQRVVEVAGDQHRLEVVGPRSATTPTASTTGISSRRRARRSSPYSRRGDRSRQLLERVDGARRSRRSARRGGEMPRTTSTSRSARHSSSGCSHGRSRKSGCPVRATSWRRAASVI